MSRLYQSETYPQIPIQNTPPSSSGAIPSILLGPGLDGHTTLNLGCLPLAESPGECGGVRAWGGLAAGAHKNCGGVEHQGKAGGLTDVVGWPRCHLLARVVPWNRSAPSGCMDCLHGAVPMGAAKPLPRCPKDGQTQ